MQERGVYHSLWRKVSAAKRMVFVSGPRQSGKTFFATQIVAPAFANRLYFNYDDLAGKRQLVENPLFFREMNRTDASLPLVILDEIHKYPGWKNYLKGVFDPFSQEFLFLVSGSGRLETYARGGDSLAGRYSMLRLWPFTLGELGNNDVPLLDFLRDPTRIPPRLSAPAARKTWRLLEALSGFPEPFLTGDKHHYNRWSASYHRQVIYEDIRDVAQIRKADKVATLYSLLPTRLGSPLSKNNLAEDISVSPTSVDEWLMLFERFLLTFSLAVLDAHRYELGAAREQEGKQEHGGQPGR